MSREFFVLQLLKRYLIFGSEYDTIIVSTCQAHFLGKERKAKMEAYNE